MIPIDKVRDIISKHKLLEKELSSNEIDKKNFAKKKALLELPTSTEEKFFKVSNYYTPHIRGVFYLWDDG